MSSLTPELVESLPVPAMRADPAGHFLFANRRWHEESGVSSNHAREWGWLGIARAEDRASLEALFAQRLQPGQTLERRFRQRLSDGYYLAMILRVAPLFEPDGMLCGYLIVLLPAVSEPGSASGEETLSRVYAPARIAEIEAATHIGRFAHHLRTDVYELSDEALRIFGRDASERRITLTTEEILTRIHEDDRARVLENQRNVIASGQPFTDEGRILRPDGEVRFIRVVGDCDRDVTGAVITIRGVIQDVTAHKLEEAARRHVEERYALTTEAMGEGILDWDLLSGEVYVSDRARSFIELPAAEPISGETIISRVHADDRALVQDSLHRLFELGARYDIEHRIVRSDGAVAWIRARGIAAHDKSGRVVRAVFSLRDISDRKQAEQRAEAALRAKSDFLAVMSHEMRTPLNGILGMAGLMLERPQPPEERRQVELIQTSAEALLSLIDDILVFTQLETGKLVLDSADFDLVRIIEEVVALLTPRAAGKHVKLEAKPDPTLVRWLVGDRGRMRQVLFNLVGNAIKFTESGSVTVRATHRMLEEDCAEIRISVEDTGIGIAPHLRSRLFKTFSQADSSISRRYGGSGLGLAISKHLIELMGGTIDLQSTPGVGSTFWFTIPCRLGEPRIEERPRFLPTPEELDCPSLNVLLAEDNEINQKVITAVLAGLGHYCTIVSNGVEAVETVKARRFDAVLMDIQMPQMDGLSATQAIRALGDSWMKMPIIALTANAMIGDRERYLSAGFDEYIAKPVDPRALAYALTVCAGKGMMRAPPRAEDRPKADDIAVCDARHDADLPPAAEGALRRLLKRLV